MLRSREPWDEVKRPNRSKAVKIRVEEAASQETSPLFALPAEIRSLIFEYVVGTGVIHVRVRDCSPSENCLSMTRYKEFYTPESGVPGIQQFRFVDLPTKFTYARCRKPDDWDKQYELSKHPATIPPVCFDSQGNLPMDAQDESIVKGYGFSHNVCVQEVIRDFCSQDYRDGCSRMHRDNLKDSGCKACTAKYDRLVESYGPPLQGLKAFHAHTGIDLRFLHTCRQIYKEAWHLPYESYVFDIPGPLTTYLQDFATRMLYPHQSELVAGLHTSGISASSWPEDFECRLRCFPGLKKLQLSLNPGDCLLENEDRWKPFFQINTLHSVQVIVGFDRDQCDVRLEERKRANATEKLLMRRV